MNDVSACRSVLIEVLTVLARDLDKLAVVGGWVPELLFPGRGHVGSLDVDLALDPRKLPPLAYESIRNKLLGAGYEQDREMPNRFRRRVPVSGGPALEVRVDLITGDFPGLAPGAASLPIQELAVSRLRGVELAFDFPQAVTVDGDLPEGRGHNRVRATLPTAAAYVAIKAITLGERMKEKDAYDICFCVDHFPGGYRALAADLRGKLDHPLIREGVAVLRDKFARLDGTGPVWAARTAVQAAGAAAGTLEGEQRRAYELVNALLRAIEESPG